MITELEARRVSSVWTGTVLEEPCPEGAGEEVRPARAAAKEHRTRSRASDTTIPSRADSGPCGSRATGTTLAILALALLTTAPALAQRRRAEPAGPTTVITGARVYDGVADEPIENATIVLRGERIVSIAAGGAAPAGATVIDATGLTVTPGLVAALSSIGLEEVELEPSTRDTGHESGEDGVRASFAAADGYNPLSILIPVARTGGITSVVSTPEGGLVSGTSAWADLSGESPTDAIRDASLALHVNFDETGFGAAFGARSAAMAALREIFDAARLYARSHAGWDRGDFRDVHEGDLSRLDLERLAEAAGGDLPVVVHVSRADDIVRILALAAELDLHLVLTGVEEGWIVADEIAAANVPVILRPLANLPTTFATLHTRYDNAALLERAGVRVALVTEGAWSLHNLRQEAGNAVRAGMSYAAAMRAVTSVPASIFGMDDYGTLAAGKMASLVVWSGDPFEVTTVARRVLVRGEEMSLRTRMTELFERYRDLETAPRGWRGIPTVPEPEGEESIEELEAEGDIDD